MRQSCFEICETVNAGEALESVSDDIFTEMRQLSFETCETVNAAGNRYLDVCVFCREIVSYYLIFLSYFCEFRNGKYYEKTDIWSLGITLYDLYFGFPPYGKIDELDLALM